MNQALERAPKFCHARRDTCTPPGRDSDRNSFGPGIRGARAQRGSIISERRQPRTRTFWNNHGPKPPGWADEADDG